MNQNFQKDFLERAATHAGSMYRLCQLAVLDESNVSKMRTGKRRLSLTQLVDICEAVGIDPWEELNPWCIDNAPKLAKFIGGVRRLEHLIEQAHPNGSTR